MSRFLTNSQTDIQTNKQTDRTEKDHLKKYICIYIHMTHVNFFHRLLVSETQTDRQDKFAIDICMQIFVCVYIV